MSPCFTVSGPSNLLSHSRNRALMRAPQRDRGEWRVGSGRHTHLTHLTRCTLSCPRATQERRHPALGMVLSVASLRAPVSQQDDVQGRAKSICGEHRTHKSGPVQTLPPDDSERRAARRRECVRAAGAAHRAVCASHECVRRAASRIGGRCGPRGPRQGRDARDGACGAVGGALSGTISGTIVSGREPLLVDGHPSRVANTLYQVEKQRVLAGRYQLRVSEPRLKSSY